MTRHKNAQDQREPRKIGLNINNPEIKGTALIYNYILWNWWRSSGTGGVPLELVA